ncbi:hypothetical protein BKA62DRAFT_769122 [Auriculariales sp. MPI-PUGE-AT-0066]|nr:hypothetical protein BKA62DRAFT_769122 [Auriculariales sp. MPI-PUGE-AT-0066]
MAASKPANTRSTSPYTMTRSSSNGSSSRKATPGSTVSKSSGGGANAVSSSWNGRTLVFGEATESGRRGISRPMDTANSSVSTSSHHSHALPRTSVDTHGAVAERDPKDRRGSVEGRRSQLSAVRGRGFEHGAFAFEKPRIAPPLGSSLTPPTHQRPSLHSTNSANGSVNVVRNVEEGAKDGQFGSTSSRGRSGTDRSTRSKPQTEEINEKSGMFFGLGRTASTGATKRQPAIDEKRRGGSLREKRERSDTYAAEELSPKRKSSGSSLTRLWIQKTKEALCAGRPPSPLSRTEPPRIVRTSAKTTTTNGAVAHANASPQQPGQAAAAARKRKPLPISTHLPMFRFEPASAAGRMTPDSMHSRGTSGTHGGTGPREHAKERAAAAAAVSVAAAKVQFNHATNTPKSSKKRDSGGSGSDAGTQNLYDAFCGELRRVVGDDAFVVFEKYVRQYEDKVFPLLGPRGLIERLKKILDLSHAGEDRKREVVDRFLQVVRSSEAAS